MGVKEDLSAAFAGESQANRRYMAFAKKADEEGLSNIARLFRAVADAETVHALNHLSVTGIGKTKDNLKEAIQGESYENKEMYPKFIKDAKSESNTEAERSFVFANTVEKTHQKLFENALEMLNNSKNIEEEQFFVCQVCGNTVSEVPDKCPVCGMPRSQFKKID